MEMGQAVGIEGSTEGVAQEGGSEYTSTGKERALSCDHFFRPFASFIPSGGSDGLTSAKARLMLPDPRLTCADKNGVNLGRA